MFSAKYVKVLFKCAWLLINISHNFCRRDWAVPREGEGGVGSSSTLAMPHIGGLFSDPDVQSLWSYNLVESGPRPSLTKE